MCLTNIHTSLTKAKFAETTGSQWPESTVPCIVCCVGMIETRLIPIPSSRTIRNERNWKWRANNCACVCVCVVYGCDAIQNVPPVHGSKLAVSPRIKTLLQSDTHLDYTNLMKDTTSKHINTNAPQTTTLVKYIGYHSYALHEIQSAHF